MKKKIRTIFLLSILFVFYIYVVNITFLPESIVLMQGERLRLNFCHGINIKENLTSSTYENKLNNLIEVSSNAEDLERVGKFDLNVSLLNIIPLKEVSLNIIPKTKVIPLGNAIALKLYTKGVLIVGKTQIDGKKPYENMDIEEGDRIISVDNKEINGTDDLIEAIKYSKGEEIEIKYIRGEEEKKGLIKPIRYLNDEYKIGLWVRDASAGVGTASFYIPETKMFACLGHGISDVDTEKLLTISSGELVTTQLVSITKGKIRETAEK